MKRNLKFQTILVLLVSSGLLVGCGDSNQTNETDTPLTQDNPSQEPLEEPTQEEASDDLPVLEEESSIESEQTDKEETDSWTDELHQNEMENLLFFRWDTLVEGIPYQVISRSVDELGYATVVIDLNEIERVQKETGLSREKTMYEMVRNIVSTFPDQEKEGYLFTGYRISFALLESAMAGELIMTSDDYVRTDWSTFEGTLASGERMTIYSLDEMQ